MRIVDLIDEKSIRLDAVASSKEAVLDAAIELMVAGGKISNTEAYRAGVYAREKEGSTGIGEGIAIPHCKSKAVLKPGLSAMVIPQGVDFDSIDGEKVYLLFLIAAPDTKDNVHLDVLSKLSVLLMDEAFTRKLIASKTTKEFLELIDDEDRKRTLRTEEEATTGEEGASHVASSEGKANASHVASSEGKANASHVAYAPHASNAEGGLRLLAVTGCPTGIAHTYMAAESLQKKAKEMGHAIKVETRGSGGAKNVLTQEEISQADGIIVASDTQVPMERFDGKTVIICKVADGISRAQELISKIENGEASQYKAVGAKQMVVDDDKKEGVGHQIYKHLMNGVSHMLPFVVGGGILIALAFLIDGILVDLNQIPQHLIDKFGSVDDVKNNFGELTPIAAFLKAKVGGVAFGFMLPVLAGYIAMSIADRPGLALGVLGGAIAANGTSGFLGAIVAGFAAGYLVMLLKKLFEKLPESIDGLKPVLIYPFFGMLLVGALMIFAVEPLVGWLNTAINDGLTNMGSANKVLLGALLGGMMAVDMGGPVNKAAYAFGIAQISAGNYGIMAAVMVGGMVPPLAIAIAAMLFRSKFTAEERKAAPTNIVMGLSFISEGAIPFAAADPLRVIPSCMAGSAVAGALASAFQCTLMAPHGGIFVFPVVGNASLYVVALLTGSFLGAILIGALKKKIA